MTSVIAICAIFSMTCLAWCALSLADMARTKRQALDEAVRLSEFMRENPDLFRTYRRAERVASDDAERMRWS